MKLPDRTIFKVALRLLPGWIFLLAGIGTVMACLLMPAIQEYRLMQWRQQTLASQLHLLDQQAGIYKKFDTALDEQDPILLQRLAYSQLGLIPQGTGPVNTSQPLPPVGDSTYTTQQTDGWFYAPTSTSMSGQDVFDSVLEPGQMPLTTQPPQPASTTFLRLSTGKLRPWVMLLGLVGIVLGLMSHPPAVKRFSD
ncbi:MAG TPA: hypothetical protein DCM28_05350 [Phycisphaerales bacterium]|nr:hypothetical protein [Phycisphaerales bacterium]